MKENTSHIAIIVPYKSGENAPWGPIQSIAAIAQYLKGRIRYTLLLQNSDLEETFFNEKYLKDAIYHQPVVSFLFLLRFLKGKDIVWIHSIYSVTFSILPIISLCFLRHRKIVISCRGQLLSGALDRKKRIFLWLYFLLLKISWHQIFLHFTNEREKEASFTAGFSFEHIVFAGPLPPIEKNAKVVLPEGNKNVLGFFGRIAPIKNIEYGIRLLSQLPDSFSIRIYGTGVDENYYNRLKNYANTLEVADRIFYHGTYEVQELEDLMKQVDVVLIPSHSENFCHVFFESIRYSKMLVASTGVPWWDLNSFVPKTLLPLQEELWIERLTEISKMTNAEINQVIAQLQNFYRTKARELDQGMEESIEKIILVP